MHSAFQPPGGLLNLNLSAHAARWGATLLGVAGLAACAADAGRAGGVDAHATDSTLAVDTAPDSRGPVDTTFTPPTPRESCVGFDVPGDPSDALFDPGCVIDVTVRMDSADFSALRGQTRTLLDLTAGDCLSHPPADVFTWFEAEVAVGGRVVSRAGIRKKGFFGSLDDQKPSLKVRFDRFVDGQRLAGMRRLTLNNMRQDPGLVTTCVAYGWMRGIGMVAPRCNFARVRVNGEDLGVYAHVESLKKPFLARHFPSDEGNLYEATLSDFRDPFWGTWEKKTNETEDDWRDLRAVGAALEVPDDNLILALEQVVDLDAFYTFWAAEVLVGHWDGYTGNLNNTYVYGAPSDRGRFRFLPWGIDAAFGPTPELFGERELPDGVYAHGYLAHRLYAHPDGRARYLARLDTLLRDAWDADALVAEIDRMEALVLAELPAHLHDDVRVANEGKRYFVRDRADAIAAATTPTPEWTEPLPEPLCWPDVGSIDGTFDTVFGTYDWQWPGAGTGTLALDYEGAPYLVHNVRTNAFIGSNEDVNAGDVVIELVGRGDDDAWVAVWLIVPPLLLHADVALPIDWLTFRGWVGRTTSFDREAFELLGVLADGNVTLTEAATLPNEWMRGRFEARILKTE